MSSVTRLMSICIENFFSICFIACFVGILGYSILISMNLEFHIKAVQIYRLYSKLGLYRCKMHLDKQVLHHLEKNTSIEQYGHKSIY